MKTDSATSSWLTEAQPNTVDLQVHPMAGDGIILFGRVRASTILPLV